MLFRCQRGDLHRFYANLLVSCAANFAYRVEVMQRCFVVIRSKRCQGRVSQIEEGDKIVRHFTTCHSNGVITGWQSTLWDFSECRQLQ